jgi:hypothetical protein
MPKHVLRLAAILEIATGLGLLVVPSLVGMLLLGAEFTGVAMFVARVLGIALISFGLTCWPATPLVGMSLYGGAVALYLAYLAIASGVGGVLLWPVVGLHALITLGCIAQSFLYRNRESLLSGPDEAESRAQALFADARSAASNAEETVDEAE